MRIQFEDKAEPGVFETSGSAVRDKEGGAGGMWAAVPNLPRPERAEIAIAGSGRHHGKTAVVALFRTGGSVIRVSNEAADALGIGGEPVDVRITALRSVPEIDY